MPGLPLFCLTRFRAARGRRVRPRLHQSPVPKRPSSLPAVGVSTLLGRPGLHPFPLKASSLAGHLWQDSFESCGRSLLSPVGPSLLRATMASADFSLRHNRRCRPFRHEARSPRVRTTPFHARPPDLRRRPLTMGASRFLPARPRRHRLISGFCSSARAFAPRFLPTVGRPSAVALRLDHYGLFSGGLTPPRCRPCRAHKQKASLAGGLLEQD